MVSVQDNDLDKVHRLAEAGYPEEIAGLMLGLSEATGTGAISIRGILPMENRREAVARRRRYQIAPKDWLQGEYEAAQRGLALLGVFHSHPDHPAVPSEDDLETALPNLVYLITSVFNGKAIGTRAWMLKEDRSAFHESVVQIV